MVAMFCGLLRVDASQEMATEYKFDLLRNDGKPLCFFNKNFPAYSQLGMFLLNEFWASSSNLGVVSWLLRAGSIAEVDKVLYRTITL